MLRRGLSRADGSAPQDNADARSAGDRQLPRLHPISDRESDEVDAGFERATVVKVLQMVKRAEYKRRQAPPGVRVSSRAFGRDWRYPITSGY